MIAYKYLFNTYEAILASNVILADNDICEAIEIGFSIVEVVVNGQTNRIKFKKIFHISKMKQNLLSMSKLIMEGFIV